MPIAVQCPQCKHPFRTDKPDAGQPVQCPQCATTIVLPVETAVSDRVHQPTRQASNPLAFVAISLGALLVLCLGGCAGVWFWYLKPMGKDVAQKIDDLKQIQNDLQNPPQDELFAWDKVRKIKSGTTRREVLAQLGDALPADEIMIDGLASGVAPINRERFVLRWKGRWKSNMVWAYEPEDGLLLVCYDPHERLIGMVGRVNGAVTELIALPADPSESKSEDTTPKATFTVSELEQQAHQYIGQYVAVKGRYHRDDFGGKGAFSFVGLQKAVVVRPPAKGGIEWSDPPEPLETVEIVGKVTSSNSERLVLLTSARLVRRTPPEKPIEASALEITTEYDKDAVAAEKKYAGKIVKVTGTVASSSSAGNHIAFRGLQDIRQKKGLFIDCAFEPDQRDAAKNMPLNSTATVVGLFKGNAKTNVSGAITYEMVLCRVAK